MCVRVCARTCVLVFRGTQGIELSSNLVKAVGTENDQNYNKILPRLCPINAVITLVGKGSKKDTMWRLWT